MLAIIIPFYKIEYFSETIEALLRQTDKNFKVYIGNDASPENPEKIVHKLKGHIDYVYKRFDTNLGAKSLTAHWQRCVEMIEAEEWFMILGDDDYISDNFVQEFNKMQNNIEHLNISVVKAAQQWIDSHNTPLNRISQYDEISDALKHFENKYLGKDRMSLSEHIFKLEAFKKVRFAELPLAWWSDVVAFLEVSGFNKVYFLKNAVVYVRISKHSISGSDENISSKNFANLKFLEYMLNHHGNKLSNHIYRILYNDFRYYNDLTGSNLNELKPLWNKISIRERFRYLKQRFLS